MVRIMVSRFLILFIPRLAHDVKVCEEFFALDGDFDAGLDGVDLGESPVG
jgi:hypothetical protein